MGKHGFIENADRLIRWAQLQLQYSVVGSDKIEQEHAISYDSAYFVHWVLLETKQIWLLLYLHVI